MRNHDRSICKTVEDLLIRSGDEDLTPEERLVVAEHVNGCEQCARFRDLLSRIRNDIGRHPHAPESLRRNILARAHAAMNARKAPEPAPAPGVWQTLKNVLNYRLPLYQPAAVIAILIAIVTIFSPVKRTSQENENLYMLARTYSEKIWVVDNMFHISEQNTGSSVEEDSSIVKYVVPTM
jgi:anti-sigma factor RsiW